LRALGHTRSARHGARGRGTAYSWHVHDPGADEGCMDAGDVLSTGQVARMLGLTQVTVRRLVTDGLLVAARDAPHLGFRRDDVLAYLESARIPPGSLGIAGTDD